MKLIQLRTLVDFWFIKQRLLRGVRTQGFISLNIFWRTKNLAFGHTSELPLSGNYRSLTGKKWGGPKILNVSGQNDRLEIRPCPHRAETGENDPVLFHAEYSRRWFSTEKSGGHQPCAHTACALYTNIQSRGDSTIEQNKIERVLCSPVAIHTGEHRTLFGKSGEDRTFSGKRVLCSPQSINL